MRRIGLTAVGSLGVAALILSSAPPLASASELTDGPAEVALDVCAAGNSQTDTFVPGCSYLYLTPKVAPAYTYLSSQGAVSWVGGSLSGTALTFPAAGQTWPPLTGLYLGSSIVATPKNITGTVDGNGRVGLTLDYELLVTIGSSQCTLSGTTALSSQGVEKLGGQAAGQAFDPVRGAFAVVSTSYTPPAQTGNCLAVNTAYDLSTGVGWYLNGSLQVPLKPQPQTATVKLPKKIKAKGKTVVLGKAVVTNAGQTATAKLTWSTKKSAKGAKAKYANLETNKSGKVTIRTTGKAKRLYVKLSLRAPAVPGYEAYSFTKKWTVKR